MTVLILAIATIYLAPPTDMAIEETLLRELKSKTAVEDVLHVAREAEVDPILLGVSVQRESGGNHGVLRYCTKWSGRECLKEKSCYSNCRKRSVWKNRLDLGLWGLRDAPSFSWFRWYERKFGVSLPKYCGIESKCSRDVAIEVIKYMKSIPPRKCKQAGWEAWLTRWNSCGSYRGRVSTARKLYQVVYEIALF